MKIKAFYKTEHNFCRKLMYSLVTVLLFLSITNTGSLLAQPEETVRIKELNFVFLHGMGGNPCSLQLLSDWIKIQLSNYIYVYERAHPGIEIRVNTLSRCYPAFADIRTWANNIADSINTHFEDKENLILIGHSMGGKAALYAVAKNIGGLADKVSTVVTINSPIKNLGRYYAPGGGPVLNYCRTVLLGSDEGVCSSVTSYDSTNDGKWVSENRHWLAFISAENAPLSLQYDRSGVDAWPREMDDGVVPISAQYAEGADVIYYGQHEHSDLGIFDDVAGEIAHQIVRYIFGLPVECSVFAGSGTFEKEADWLLGKDQWIEVVGEVIAVSGTVQHKNESFFKWEDWEDIIGEKIPGVKRSSILVRQESLPLITSVKEIKWQAPGEPDDCRVYLRVGAAPRTTVEVNWTVYRAPLLPEGTSRSHYEVSIRNGTPLVAITQSMWSSRDIQDLRITLWSEAHSPFRWFLAEWRTYYLESRQKNIINEIPSIGLSDRR